MVSSCTKVEKRRDVGGGAHAGRNFNRVNYKPLCTRSQSLCTRLSEIVLRNYRPSILTEGNVGETIGRHLFLFPVSGTRLLLVVGKLRRRLNLVTREASVTGEN